LQLLAIFQLQLLLTGITLVFIQYFDTVGWVFCPVNNKSSYTHGCRALTWH